MADSPATGGDRAAHLSAFFTGDHRRGKCRGKVFVTERAAGLAAIGAASVLFFFLAMIVRWNDTRPEVGDRGIDGGNSCRSNTWRKAQRRRLREGDERRLTEGSSREGLAKKARRSRPSSRPPDSAAAPKLITRNVAAMRPGAVVAWLRRGGQLQLTTRQGRRAARGNASVHRTASRLARQSSKLYARLFRPPRTCKRRTASQRHMEDEVFAEQR